MDVMGEVETEAGTETPYADMLMQLDAHRIERDTGGDVTWPPHLETMGLFPYQVEAFHWLHAHPRSILADEMGLGKTVVVGRLLHYITFGGYGRQATGAGASPAPTLILGPSILAYHWQDELRSRFGLEVEVAVGTSNDDGVLLGTAPFVYTNYEKLNMERFNDVLQRRHWGTIIVDESHKVRGHNAKRSKELIRLSQRATRIHFLTGTPFPQGSPADVFVPIACCDDSIRKGGFWKFVGEWCSVATVTGKELNQGATGSWKEIGPAKQPKAFGGWMTKWMLRRTRREVGGQLPPLLRATIRHSLSPRQKRLYRSMAKGMSFETKAGVVVEAQNSAVQWERLRQLCVSPRLFDGTEEVGAKLDTLGEVFDQAFVAKRKVVIFAWHRDVVFMLAGMIEKAYGPDFEPFTIVGGMMPGEAAKAAAAFTRREGFELLIGTIAAMGTGLNLQAGNVAIFAEISYAPDDNDQALARLHRQGQANTVNVYYFVARGTIEEYIREQVLVKRVNIANLLAAHREVQIKQFERGS